MECLLQSSQRRGVGGRLEAWKRAFGGMGKGV